MALSVAVFSGRVSFGLASRPSRRSTVRVAASSEVPPNVAEARAWIAAWRAKQQTAPAASAATAAPVPAATNGKGKRRKSRKTDSDAPAAAPAAAAAPTQPKNKFGPSKSFGDGTLVFTADQLTAVQYADVKLKQKK